MTDENADAAAVDGPAEEDEGSAFHYPHPYEVEIRAFHYMPSQVGAQAGPWAWGTPSRYG